jgi:hypothetical protein
MGTKIKQVKDGSELFIKINTYSTTTFYISIILQLVTLIVSLFLVHYPYIIISIVYLIWIFLSLVFVEKITSKMLLQNLKFFPVFITVMPILYLYYFIFRNKYPAQTDDDYLRNFYRKQKIKSIL